VKQQHRALVEQLLTKTGARRQHFKRALIKELKIDRRSADLEYLADSRITPDGFVIDHARSEVICYEVETTSPINEARLGPYVDWWWYLDDLDWKLRLVILRGYSCHGVAFELDLQKVSLTWLSQRPIIVGNVSPRLIDKEKRERA
jgi:hypothetical protein